MQPWNLGLLKWPCSVGPHDQNQVVRTLSFSQSKWYQCQKNIFFVVAISLTAKCPFSAPSRGSAFLYRRRAQQARWHMDRHLTLKEFLLCFSVFSNVGCQGFTNWRICVQIVDKLLILIIISFGGFFFAAQGTKWKKQLVFVHLFSNQNFDKCCIHTTRIVKKYLPVYHPPKCPRV